MYTDEEIRSFSDYELGQKVALAKERVLVARDKNATEDMRLLLVSETGRLIAEADRRKLDLEAQPHRPEAGRKFDLGKWRFSLLPLTPILEVINVLEFGAKKYEVDNWKKVPEARERYFDASMRHIISWYQGERNDPETGYNHLAHAVCCLLFLIWFDKQEKE